MTDEVMAAFTHWWSQQGHHFDSVDGHIAMQAFAAGWWEAVRTSLENARRG